MYVVNQTVWVPFDFFWMDKKYNVNQNCLVINILYNVLMCVQQKKESPSGLELWQNLHFFGKLGCRQNVFLR